MLTVLFATHNGAHTLPRMLEALSSLEEPKGGWRLVIVDNASDDETPALLERFRDRLPLTPAYEPRRGKNVALNTGLKHVAGDLIVLTDDDIVPRDGWLARLRQAADAQPGFAIFGGRVEPLWERPPDPWILEWVDLAAAYALTDPGLVDGPIDPGLVFGPNMAVRRSVFDTGVRFDEGVGPTSGSYAMGGETALTVKLARSGLQCWHCKDAEVQHIIRDFQMTRRWVLRRAIRFGRGATRADYEAWDERPRMLFGVPRYLIRMLGEEAGRVAWSRLFAPGRPAFQARWKLNYRLGQLLEARRVFDELRR